MAHFLNDEQLKCFERDGYVIVEQFLTDDETAALKDEYKRLVDQMDPMDEKTIFASNPKDKKSNTNYDEDDYFLTSGDKIRYFFESKALDSQGNFLYDKYQCINKIGHALHWLNPTFKQITFSSKVKSVIKDLNMVEPVIIHSMFINKPPLIGSEVIPHQDATYLYCEPENKIIGLWIALEDADAENACLWFIPGSQNGSVERRMVRIEDQTKIKLKYIGANPNYNDSQFVCAPVRKGDLVVIHGKVVHKSEANTSTRPRPIYTFHVLDRNGSKFSESNWIQQTENFKFPSLFLN